MNSYKRADYYIRQVNKRKKLQKRRNIVDDLLTATIFIAFILLVLSIGGM